MITPQHPDTAAPFRPFAWLKRKAWRFVDLFAGHPCTGTGRHAISIVEWKCDRCGGLYVSLGPNGSRLLPVDRGLDTLMRDCGKLLETMDARIAAERAASSTDPLAPSPTGSPAAPSASPDAKRQTQDPVSA